MSIKWSDEPMLAHAKPRSVLGFDARVLEDGRVLMFEWVKDEQPGVVQVHDDEGRDYIKAGDPTLGMLYDDADTLLDVEGDAFLERIFEHLEAGL